MPKVTIIDIGENVQCDSCSKDYSDNEAQGGILFNRKAICPDCQQDWEEGAAKYDESKYITDRAKEGESFRSFVLRMRQGNNKITIEEYD